jgi:hypothetical protein
VTATSAQVEGLVRSLGLVAAGFALRLGIDNQTWLLLVGSVATIAGILWSWWSNRPSSVVAQAASDQGTKQITLTSQRAADAQPSSKVVGPNQ